MARTYEGLPTHEFANDPLPRGGEEARGTADLQPQEFQPVATVRLDEAQFDVTEPVNGSTPWRKTGNTDFDHFLAAISRTTPPGGQSPLVGEARQLYEILSQAGLSRFATGILWHEKKNDTWQDTPIPAWMHNPFSTRDRARPGEWEQFGSYADAARAWVTRVSNDPYPQDGSIRDFVRVYAPSSDNNNEERYVAVIAEEINALPIEGALPALPKGKPVSIPGLPGPIFVPADLVVEIQLVPPDHINNRPGIPMVPRTYTQHDTANTRAGTGADSHSNWLDTGAPGAADVQVGVHIFVDDKKAIIKTPFNEVQWHAGDGNGPGNMSSISCEICVNEDRDPVRAERNAAVLAAAIIRDGLRQGIDALAPHQHWSGKDCPHSLLPRWSSFKQTVGSLIAEGGVPAETFPGLPASMPVEVLLQLFPDANPKGPVTKFYIDYCVKHMPVGQWPRFNGFEDLSDGTRWWDFNPLHLFSDSHGNVWLAGADAKPSSTATTGASGHKELVASDLERMPPRDVAIKEAAMARDRNRSLGVTTVETALRATPEGGAVRTLPGGTQLTVLGEAADGCLPVAIRNATEEGYVRASEIAAADAGAGVTDAADMREGKHKDDRPQAAGRKPGHHGQGKGHKPEPPSPQPVPPSPIAGPTPGPVPGPAAGGNGNSGQRIAAEAERYVGYPYVWATHGPDSFDCSGLVHWVVLQATGEAISPDSHAQFNTGTPVDWDRLQPGDAVFYDTMGGTEVREGNAASHVGIYVGPNLMVNALNENAGVIESDPFSPYFKPLYLGAASDVGHLHRDREGTRPGFRLSRVP